jgi:hypothetical protein
MFFGLKKKMVGATAAVLIPVWVDAAMPDQSEKVPKFIEPHVAPESCVVPYTRCCPLKGTCEKSLSETHPDFGVASAPDDVHLYVDGRAHDCAATAPADASSAIAFVLKSLIVACFPHKNGLVEMKRSRGENWKQEARPSRFYIDRRSIVDLLLHWQRANSKDPPFMEYRRKYVLLPVLPKFLVIYEAYLTVSVARNHGTTISSESCILWAVPGSGPANCSTYDT